MNREVHYEGWLIKSPPTKRIWRARWRRRWFTLKQGEIPEQFCLEYYTDRNCRKLKGVIDLDQCEQVDCGLRLENRKQKFQFMFDIKTPKRTYYLAADTEADMRDWVNCICQVCHLHDTKQSNDMQMDRTQNTASTALTNSTNNTTTTSLNSSSSTPAGGDQQPTSMQRQSFSNDILRRTTSMTPAPAASVIDQQPKRKNDDSAAAPYQNNNSDGTYVNTDYTNRDTVIFQGHFERHQLGVAAAAAAADEVASQTDISSPQPSSAAVYLNSPVFPQTPSDSGRLVVSANGVVRKIPESLVLNTTPLPDTQSNSVQASPALSASSGPYIPISECFSGSPKFIMDSNNPTTPLNNLDPKFYDTPRCHNNIGLNLTNDQSYSPKITNCSVPQIATTTKNRSDSDSESVFTDDDEWTHPLPLRENVDRSTRPSDSSVENESFVLTYTQRFSKMTEDNGKAAAGGLEAGKSGGVTAKENSLEKLAKVLKNKNNLILDFIENGKLHRDMPQLSDTENTSPAIGPLDSTSVVEESYDIPRSQNLPYYNMAHLFEKMHSPQTTNPIASSTPNLMVGSATGGGGGLAMGGGPTAGGSTEPTALSPPATVRTLPRQHCYTNAAPSKVEGNVFRYDFIEQSNLPPVNRKLKPKVQNVEDKPPEEIAAKPPIGSKGLAAAHSHEQLDSPKVLDYLTHKFMESTMQSIPDPVGGGGAVGGGENCSPIKPPSVDRKLKPNAYKFASPGASMTMSPSSRRSTCAPLSMAGAVPNERDNYVRKTRTLPRHPPPPIYANEGDSGSSTPIMTVQHQRTASAAAALQFSQFMPSLQQHMMQQPAPAKAGNEHTLQYFDLDVANPPTINRQSMIVSNLYGAEPSTRGPSVVYIPVDFVKTEAFKRIREERKKESEGVSDGAAASSASATNK